MAKRLYAVLSIEKNARITEKNVLRRLQSKPLLLYFETKEAAQKYCELTGSTKKVRFPTKSDISQIDIQESNDAISINLNNTEYNGSPSVSKIKTLVAKNNPSQKIEIEFEDGTDIEDKAVRFATLDLHDKEKVFRYFLSNSGTNSPNSFKVTNQVNFCDIKTLNTYEYDYFRQTEQQLIILEVDVRLQVDVQLENQDSPNWKMNNSDIPESKFIINPPNMNIQNNLILNSTTHITLIDRDSDEVSDIQARANNTTPILAIGSISNSQNKTIILTSPHLQKLILLRNYIISNNTDDLNLVLQNIKATELHSLFKELKQEDLNEQQLLSSRKTLIDAYIAKQESNDFKWLIATIFTVGIAYFIRKIISDENDHHFAKKSFDFEAVRTGQKYYWEQFRTRGAPGGHASMQSKINNYGQNSETYAAHILAKQDNLRFNYKGLGELNKTVEFSTQNTAIVTGTQYQIERWEAWEKIGKQYQKDPNFFQSKLNKVDEATAKYENSLKEGREIAKNTYMPVLSK